MALRKTLTGMAWWIQVINIPEKPSRKIGILKEAGLINKLQFHNIRGGNCQEKS